jgi:hypothetical protein
MNRKRIGEKNRIYSWKQIDDFKIEAEAVWRIMILLFYADISTYYVYVNKNLITNFADIHLINQEADNSLLLQR